MHEFLFDLSDREPLVIPMTMAVPKEVDSGFARPDVQIHSIEVPSSAVIETTHNDSHDLSPVPEVSYAEPVRAIPKNVGWVFAAAGLTAAINAAQAILPPIGQ